MNERGFDRIAEAFMADGPTVLADRVFDAAFDEVHRTRQRRVLWRMPWRLPNMNTYAKFAVAAVAVIAVGYLGLTFLGPSAGGPGSVPSVVPSPTVAPTPTPLPTPEPTPTPTPQPTPAALNGQFTSERHGYSISVPADWSTRPAETAWTSGYLDFGNPGADLIHDPVLEYNLFLAIASQPLGERTPAGWEAEMWQIVADDDLAKAICASSAQPVVIDGTGGSICDKVALVTEGGRGYWVMLYTSGDEAWINSTYGDDWFASVLATMDLAPETAVD
jgi:hypothetical protein